MKKTNAGNVGGVQNKQTVQTVYPVSNEKINPTITKESVGSSSIYRNARGVVVWGESK